MVNRLLPTHSFLATFRFDVEVQVQLAVAVFDVALCQKVFGYPIEKGLQIAEEVHFTKRRFLWTGSLEVAELKQEQIHSLGKDELVNHCQGSMTAILEPAT